MTIDEQTIEEKIEFIKKGVAELISEEDLRKKLETGRSLRIKLGADPTAPDIHLGHTVVLRKLKAFQTIGHKAIFLIGDFTGMIGDPTEKNTTRPQLSRREVLENAETYKHQIFKILDPVKTEVQFNSYWFSPSDPEFSIELGIKVFETGDFIKLASHATVQQMLERDDFKKRYEAQKPIALHELLYPLVQGYDSVALNADVELGGTDQKFNLLRGRDLQRQYNPHTAPQVVITMPLLIGTDGVKKMSKSANNYIGIDEPPEQMFLKIMKLPDELIWHYYELVTDLRVDEINVLKEKISRNEISLLDVKFDDLAGRITRDFHPNANIEEIKRKFKTETMQTGKISGESTRKKVRARSTTIANLLIESGLVKSMKELKEKKDAKIFFDEEKIDNNSIKDITVEILENSQYKLQFGSKAYDLIGVKFIIEHQECLSGNLLSYGYDEESAILEVKFRDLGKAYEYYNVPLKTVEELRRLVSAEEGIGGFFNKNIRNAYSCIEIKE